VDPFVVLERFHLAIAVITVIGAAVFLLALMVMLADERRETIGTLRLIGFSRRRVLLQVLAEGALVATAGAAFGILFAWATQAPLNRFFQWRYDTALVFVRVTPEVALRCVLLAVPLGVAASLAASWTLLRREILALIGR
jgi:putative ABC transport system permease protein